MGSRILGKLEARHLEVIPGFLQEEAVGAAELEQAALRAIAPDQVDGAGELAAQHRLAAEIVAVAVGVLPGEIVLGVVGAGIKIARLAAPDAALLAGKDIAAVLGIEEALRRDAAAGWADRHVGFLQHHARRAVSMSSMYSSALATTTIMACGRSWARDLDSPSSDCASLPRTRAVVITRLTLQASPMIAAACAFSPDAAIITTRSALSTSSMRLLVRPARSFSQPSMENGAASAGVVKAEAVKKLA